MTKKLKTIATDAVLILLILAMVSCNLNYTTGGSSKVTESQLRATMPSIIDSQLDTIDSYLDDDLKNAIHNSSRGGDMTGEEIVEKTLSEEKGYDYLNFCYQVNNVQQTQDTEPLLEAASNLLSEEDYDTLCTSIDEATTKLGEYADEVSRALPLSQVKAFYKDLRTLVVRTTVLLTAGIVYAIVPNGVFWGKVSAAAGVSVSAGLVAMTVMTLYERYKFGADDTNQSFEDWFKEMIKQPKADYAMAASAMAIGKTFDKGPVVTGIVVCVFALFKATDAIRTMLLTYNLDA